MNIQQFSVKSERDFVNAHNADGGIFTENTPLKPLSLHQSAGMALSSLIKKVQSEVSKLVP
jgi:hypothetical protein